MLARTTLPDHNVALDTRQLIDHAKLEPEARALATLHLPPANQTRLSTPEALLVEHVEARITARAQQLGEEATTIEAQIEALPNPDADRNLRHLDVHVTNRLMQVFSTRIPVIRPTVTAERDARAEYNAWRDANNLNHRQPVYPLSRLEHFAWIILVALTEAACNMFLFLNATTSGLLGALATALLVAAINVGTAVFAGLVPLRYLLNRPSRIRWEYPALAVCAVIIIFVNFGAAHFRELAAAPEAFDETRVLARMINEPFNLSLMSYALFFLGLLFAIVSVWKGYHASDAYPGYESQHRRYSEKLEALDYLKSSIHGDIDAVREAEIVNATDYPYATRDLISAIRRRHAAFLAQQEKARMLDSRDATATENALARFRTLNQQIRTDGITPAYFPHPITLARNTLPADAYSHLAARIDTATAAHKAHTKDLLDLITRLLERVEAAKDNTHKIMMAIEKSHVDETALPDLSELRLLIASPTSTTGDRA